MISQKKFLDIAYEAAICFIQTEELNDEQLEALDNMSYRLCDCHECKKPLGLGRHSMGHADKDRGEIRISRVFVKSLLGNFHALGDLLLLIKLILHEIGHVLYPDFAEMDIEDKVTEWLNSFNWNEIKASPSEWPEEYKGPIHSRKDIPRSGQEDAENVLDFWQSLMDGNPERREDESLIRIISEAEQKVNDLKHVIKWKEDYRKKHVSIDETPI